MIQRAVLLLLVSLVILWAATVTGHGNELLWLTVGLATVWPLMWWLRRRRRLSKVLMYGPELRSVMSVVLSVSRWSDLMDHLGLSRDVDVRRSLSARFGGTVMRSTLGSATIRPVRYMPKIRSIDPAPYGLIITVFGVPGHHLGLWQSKEAQLVSALGVPSVRVSEPSPNCFALHLRVRDPLDSPIVLSSPVVADRGFDLALGLDENGRGVYLPWPGNSGFVCGGLPGSGKTSMLLHAVASFASRSDVQFMLIDGKGGHDLVSLAPRAYKYISGTRAGDLTVVRNALRDVRLVMEQRLHHSVELYGHHNFWQARPSAAHPAVLILMDECQVYLDLRSQVTKQDKELATEIDSLVRDLLKRGRSAGILVILATQRPTADSIPTAIRDNAALRCSFGVRTRESAVAVLGEWSSAAPVSPIGLPVGCGVALVEGGELVRFRAPYVPVDAMGQHVSQYASLTADPLDLLSKSLLALSE